MPVDPSAMPPAGKATNNVNMSFSAFDYAPARLEPGRTFLMDDYLTSGRAARRQEEHQRGVCWDVLQYQKDVEPFRPRQGFSETKFHSGFMRRQGSQMPYIAQRVCCAPCSAPASPEFEGSPGISRSMPSPVRVRRRSCATANRCSARRVHANRTTC